uniref:Uncharacterized protein n=1 Tax=Tetranychus urticae TaxID=32264 RepID=T1JXJ8_TETUR
MQGYTAWLMTNYSPIRWNFPAQIDLIYLFGHLMADLQLTLDFCQTDRLHMHRQVILPLRSGLSADFSKKRNGRC